VCDGCGDAGMSNGLYSRNELGASLTCTLGVNGCRRALRSIDLSDTQPFLDLVADYICRRLVRIAALASPYSGRGPRRRRWLEFVTGSLMSTLLMCVVTSRHYLAFHSGDGFVGVNGRWFNLDDQAGRYLANALVLGKQGASSEQVADARRLRPVASGDAAALDDVLLATDGIIDLIRDHGPRLRSFFVGTAAQDCPGGYDDRFFRRFRKHFLWADSTVLESVIQAHHDDRTFISIRRLPAAEEGQA
jgi:hypothetical protein